jgi:hypothetical protein
MTARQNGALIAATWLIGLGVVFLVRQGMNWSWTEAWPMFVILVGIGGIVGRLVRGNRNGRSAGIAGLWAYTWPVAWVVAGGALLASTTGAIAIGAGELVDRAWPWVAVGLGLWFLVGAILPQPDAPEESIAIDVGTRSEARIDVKFGAGDLNVVTARPGHLVDGTFQGGVIWREPAPNRIQLEQDVDHGLPWLDHDAVWNLGLSGTLPLDLRLDTGACRSDLDLSDVRLRTLEVHTGASQTLVRLPRAAGLTRVRAEAGAAEVVFEVPPGVAARIHGRMAIGALTVDESRFPKGLDGVYASPEDPATTNRVEIDVQGGLGSVRVVGSPAAALAA